MVLIGLIVVSIVNIFMHSSMLDWIISLVGSGIIVAYACFRLEPVLIIGQSVGFVTYSRNIVLCIKNKK